MTNTNGHTPAGWYADPSGSQQLRWWDGIQWTEHYTAAQAAPAQPTQPVAPAAQSPAPQYGQTAPAAAPYGQTYAPQRPQLAPGAAIYNVFIWLVVALPFIPVLLLPFWNPLNGFAIVQGPDGEVRGITDPGSFVSPIYFVILAVSLIADALVIVFAYLDYRDLERKGVVRPFHWAWSFFVFLNPGFLVYVIGRSVIVRRVAPGRGLAPIWVSIGLYVLSFIIAIFWVAALFNNLAHMLPRDSGFGA
ncbi:DUF2510 domain-containing protein [Leifsonia sp. NPDC058292]|uniref:DUF2510 domain-containing protein n=1 Tax=Leifsonia sp. NPDC058292 TaxID=3346428 RepID=UPI0036D7BC3B